VARMLEAREMALLADQREEPERPFASGCER
jgi:hypothetical protein